MIPVNGDACNDRLMRITQPSLSFRQEEDPEEQATRLRDCFRSLLGMDVIESNAAPLSSPLLEYTEKKDGYTEIRFLFESEQDCLVPCYLLLPDGDGRFPLVITLQGHTTGVHNSIGKPLFPGDDAYIASRGDFARQAVAQGYAALAIEQRGMGERASKAENRSTGCRFASNRALLLGKTLLGERIFDISRAIDVIPLLPAELSGKIDLSRIACTGNSGGGTATYYAACYDPRICVAAPSCSVCSYADSIGDLYHCECNYIPRALRFFEMGDLALLIAPRRLIVIAGEKDPIFPIGGVRAAFRTIDAIYHKTGCPDHARLIVTPRDHYWCKDQIWPAIRDALR